MLEWKSRLVILLAVAAMLAAVAASGGFLGFHNYGW
jgi:hypothetical protein